MKDSQGNLLKNLKARFDVQFLFSLLKPKSQDEDSKRREFIFNIIILGSIIFSAISNITLLYNYLKLKDSYQGLPFYVTFLVFLFFLSLYLLSRKGYFNISAYILLATYFITSSYVVALWGINLPLGILLYVLVVVISGILVSTRFAFFTTILVSISLLAINHLHRISFFEPHLYWKDNLPEANDILIRIIVFGIIAVISWLSNREIEKSLKRARKSEKELKKEKDMLEIRVEERTKELKETQIEKLSQLSRFAEIGQISAGMFHDLANPLTAVSLSLEQVQNKGKLKETKEHLKQALKATEHMGKFLQAIKKQIQLRELSQNFSPAEEIDQAILILGYKIRSNRVEISFTHPSRPITLFGNSIKFHQMITNLISNAIDSLNEKKSEEARTVHVSMKEKNGYAVIEIEDNGKGIEKENIEKIFDPFFTTKDIAKGTGIGLFTVKQTIEKDLKGIIELKSQPNSGTTFIIKIPVKNEE